MKSSSDWIDSSRDYDAEALIRILVLAALERSSVEDISNFQRELGGDPSPDTAMRALRRVYADQSRIEIEQHVAAMLQQTVLQLPYFGRRRKPKVVLAIDFHDEEYFGKDLHDQSGEHLNHYTPQSDKAEQALRYATLSIVCINEIFHQPLTIGFVVQSIGQPMEVVIQRLLDQIDLPLKIDRLLIDGGFATVRVLKYLDEVVKIPWFPYDLKKGQKDEYRVEGYLFEEETKNGSTEHILLLCAKRWTVTVPKARQLYRQRFRIENTYHHARKMKIVTSTTDIQLRWILWAIAHFLELLWQILRLVHQFQNLDEDLIRQDRFMKLISRILGKEL